MKDLIQVVLCATLANVILADYDIPGATFVKISQKVNSPPITYGILFSEIKVLFSAFHFQNIRKFNPSRDFKNYYCTFMRDTTNPLKLGKGTIIGDDNAGHVAIVYIEKSVSYPRIPIRSKHLSNGAFAYAINPSRGHSIRVVVSKFEREIYIDPCLPQVPIDSEDLDGFLFTEAFELIGVTNYANLGRTHLTGEISRVYTNLFRLNVHDEIHFTRLNNL